MHIKVHGAVRLFVLCLTVILMSIGLAAFMPINLALADGDDYPSKWKNAELDSAVDDWLQYNRECTSFVAWALHSRNHFELPRIAGKRGAADWGYKENSGFAANSNPAVGAVAWWDYGYDVNGKDKGGHVAWVESVSADGKSVVIQEYNNPARSGNYNRRTIATSSPKGYIHFKDLDGSSNPAPPPDPYFHGTPPDYAVIENHEDSGHKYVAIGGKLIWIPPETIWRYVDQMHSKIPSGLFHEIVWMHGSDIHSMEYGFGGNRVNVPAESSFFYENGGQQQYIIRFGYAFPVAGLDELSYLGGVNRAIMVPQGTYQRLSGTPDIPNDVLFRSPGPALYHEVNGIGFWVPDTPTADCVRVAKRATFLPVPESLISWLWAAGRLSNSPTHCEFPHGQVLYGQGSGRQTIMLYGGAFAIASPEEAASIGAINLAQPVDDVTIDRLLGKTPQVPEGHVFRAGLESAAYQYADGTLRPIDAPLSRDCLLVGGNLGVGEEVVPQSFVQSFPHGAPAQCQLDNKQLLSPDGVRVDHVKDGIRHWVPNAAVRDCLNARSGAGQPVRSSGILWDSFSVGANAYCPYEKEAGLNFVQEQGSPIVWLVGPAAGGVGIKRHAGTLCVNDPYTTLIKAAHVFVVPAGETAGHVLGPDWWPTSADCQNLPQG